MPPPHPSWSSLSLCAAPGGPRPLLLPPLLTQHAHVHACGRGQVCLSLWDPHIPVIHDSLFGAGKLKIVNVATQGLLYLEWPYHFQLDFLWCAAPPR
jgi:hypothetical protein